MPKYNCPICSGSMTSHGLKFKDGKKSGYALRRFRCLDCRYKAYETTLNKIVNNPSFFPKISDDVRDSRLQKVLSKPSQKPQRKSSRKSQSIPSSKFRSDFEDGLVYHGSSDVLDGSFCVLYDGYFKR